MYNVDLAMCNGMDTVITHVEHIPFYSRWAARKYSREVIKCIDVYHITIMDMETGEIVLELNNDGSIEWDSEG